MFRIGVLEWFSQKDSSNLRGRFLKGLSDKKVVFKVIRVMKFDEKK